MKICDIHTHILPGIDDGAQNFAQAQGMIRNASASNVEYLMVTPHCNRGENRTAGFLREQFRRLVDTAADIPVKLGLGAEVHVTENLPQLLKDSPYPTLNGSRYLLTEFPFSWDQQAFLPMLEELLSLGYVPLVAHPERYESVIQNPATVIPWLERGCHIQLTGASILGKYGSRIHRTSEYLLKNGLVCCVASDAHGEERRNNNLLEVRSYLKLYYSRAWADALLWENPMKIWRDETF